MIKLASSQLTEIDDINQYIYSVYKKHVLYAVMNMIYKTKLDDSAWQRIVGKHTLSIYKLKQDRNLQECNVCLDEYSYGVLLYIKWSYVDVIHIIDRECIACCIECLSRCLEVL
jgi:hypothetical protein